MNANRSSSSVARSLNLIALYAAIVIMTAFAFSVSAQSETTIVTPEPVPEPPGAPGPPGGADPCPTDFCGVGGAQPSASFHYPTCDNFCGREDWYLNNVPSSVASYTFSPEFTYADQSTRLTINIQPDAKPGG